MKRVVITVIAAFLLGFGVAPAEASTFKPAKATTTVSVSKCPYNIPYQWRRAIERRYPSLRCPSHYGNHHRF